MDNKNYEKYELIDLAKYGSSARKEIRPRVYVAENGEYPKGDMMDINMQALLFDKAMNNKILFYDTTEQFEAAIDTIPNDAVVFIKDQQRIWANGTYYSGGGDSHGESFITEYIASTETLVFITI